MSFLARTLCLAATTLCTRAHATQDAGAPTERAPIELPAGPVATAFASAIAASGPAAAKAPDDLGGAENAPGFARGAWEAPATWDAWASTLKAESSAASADPERRARLCLLALEQERYEDAWQHACRTSDAWRAALLPRFLPGVPARVPLADARRIALADGVTLTPSLPPATPNAPPGRVDRRAMRIADVQIGAAHVSLQLAVEPEGVQIEIAHVSGGAARVAVRLPSDARYAFENEYVDWYRQERPGIAHPIEVKPGEEPHVIYGRFMPRALEHPTRLPDALPAQLVRGTLWVRCAQGESELCAALAKSLEQGPLAITTEILAPGAQPSSQSGIQFDLTAPDERARKIAWLVSSVERMALAAR